MAQILTGGQYFQGSPEQKLQEYVERSPGEDLEARRDVGKNIQPSLGCGEGDQSWSRELQAVHLWCV